MDAIARPRVIALHPGHASLVAGAATVFVGALLSDIAYARDPQPQWANFASWLIVGGMVLAGFALLWSLLSLMTPDGRRRRALVALGLLALTFVVGFLDALMHTRDAWAMMPGGLILSILLAAGGIATAWTAFAGAPKGDFQ